MHMRYSCLMFCCACLSAQSGPNPQDLLRKVADTYKQSKSYQFEGVMRQNDKEETPVASAAVRPDMKRVENHGLRRDATLRVFDGQTVWDYRFASNEFTKQPQASYKRSETDVARDPVERYEKLDVVGGQVRYLREEPLEIRGAKVDCYVVEEIPGPLGSTTYWIDKARYIVLRESTVFNVRNPNTGQAIHPTDVVTWNVSRINEPVPDALFRFVPPDGATEVAEFTTPANRRVWAAMPALPPDPDLVGNPAPDFTLKDMDGHEVALKDLRGKAVLLTFWFTSCPPCRVEMPQLEALYEALKDKGLVVVAINNTETAEVAKKFFAEQGFTFPSLLDPAGEANEQYGEGGYPRTILIDKDGIVRDFQRGFGPRVDLRAKVKKLGFDAPSVAPPPAAPAQGQDPQQQMALDGIQVPPNMTDPAITNFNFPHTIYVNREIVVSHKPDLAADRHQLLLFIPGTHVPGGPRGDKGPSGFLQLAANLGYHAAKLVYPDETAAAQVCNNDKDPLAFESFRMSIIAGSSSPHIEVSRTDSIENRLIKLLLLLKQIRPKERWEQFLNEDGGIKWESIVVAGQSQGGGHAALIAIKHRVARVICTGAPKDYSHALDKPVAWYLEASATPKGRFFAFNHLQDRMGDCSLKQQMENLKALGLNEFGAADVDTDKPPYRHARILTTNYPGGQVSSGEAHSSVIAKELFKDVWSYMLTEPVR